MCMVSEWGLSLLDVCIGAFMVSHSHSLCWDREDAITIQQAVDMAASATLHIG